MTQDEINKCVVLVIEARKIIKELRQAGLIKDSYSTIMNAGFQRHRKAAKEGGARRGVIRAAVLDLERASGASPASDATQRYLASFFVRGRHDDN